MNTNQAQAYFKNGLAGTIDSAEITAMWRVVMKHIMNYDPVDLILRGDSELPQFMQSRLDHIIGRLVQHEPLQYILGEAFFHGHKFEVTRDTLIPRPETEQLVDMIVDENPQSDLKVLDLGTGSGCIAISLACALRFASVTAIDISSAALEVAQRNAQACKARIAFLQGDILNLECLPCEPLDIIVSNPPYICDSEQESMEPNVLDYEPHTALFVPDAQPLLFYDAIASYALRALRPGGRLYLEINQRYGNETMLMLQNYGFENARVHRDSWGNDRFVTATMQKK